MWWPTLRTSSSERPGSTSSDAVGGGVGAVAVHACGSTVSPPLGKVAVSSPVIRPSQVR